ncbi:hypothetical protein VT84_05745 [Gemmata sp. SH-PL17]|uniref:hypothetical protein n=1 Tax=Gemmata sp. SH-PL17 TaxID=1630693 RepID=UPI0004AEE659|nr:hypothetical protein [Gemmata sp. SH-PL17]AMV23896.1 hypothetical protein VT84_05745 [Gemmata sp. SH-PL17]
MTRWHTSNELHLTTATVAAKTLYTAAGLETGYALGLDLDTAARVELEAGMSGTSDTSG